jgi:Kdo2-lipid IVA lauroyltransferase/acyltransferase
MKVRFVDRLVYWLARVAIGAAARVPEAIGYGLADGLGRLWFRFDGRRRRYALRFLRNAYPAWSDRQRLRVAARATGSLFMVPLDMARLTRLLARGGSVFEVVDDTQARAALDAVSPPFLGLTAHLGSWEVAAVTMAQAFGHAHGVARVSKNPLLQQWILHNRESGGLTIHPRRGGVRGLAEAVAKGGVGLQVVDQNQRLRGVFAPFFGEVASCERAAASLALRHGYPIVVGAALRRGRRFRFDFVAMPPFTLERTDDKAADLRAAVTRINASLEEMIRMRPEQYLWIHDRYRTQPEPGGAGTAAAEAGDDEP